MPDIAVYPGTFDPITNGHLDIIERASRHVATVVVGVSQNPSKQPLFSLEERVAIVKESVAAINGVEVDSFEGLLVDYCVRRGASLVVKGLRAVSDFEYEMQMAQMNLRLAGVDTLFMVANPSFSFLSSSIVKEVARFGGSVEGLVPGVVVRLLKEKIGGEV
jgi:pantetheine-phosphate adenylyltransferase